MNSGTLRKRTRRTIVKVNGLGTIPYSENLDSVNIASIWSFSRPSEAGVNKAIRKFKNGLSSNQRTSYENKRITRNPMYNNPDLDVEACDSEDPPPPYSSQMSVVQIQQEGEYHKRPHLLSDACYNRIRIIIFLGMLCFNYPWVWNRKTHRIDRWSPFMVKIWTLYWYFTTVQSTFMIIYHSYCLIGIYSSDLPSYRGIFAYSLIIYWYACHLGYKTCIFLYGDQMRKYINQLQEFNEEYVQKYLVYADKDIEFSAARLIIKFSIPAAASQIANSLFFFLAMPYQPYYLTSMINPRPWYALIPGVIQEFTMIGQTILTYITVSWMQIAHTSSIEFWLREMHKDNDTPYTTDQLRTTRVAIPSYRSLQLLCTDFNECMSQWCLPVWKFSVAFGFIPCGYLWIRSMNKVFVEEFPGIMVYPFGTVNCFTMGFGCLTMAAEMFDIANSYIDSWSRTKQKDFRRILLSFPTLKVKVGRYYFITASTMITFFQVMTGTSTLLLLMCIIDGIIKIVDQNLQLNNIYSYI